MTDWYRRKTWTKADEEEFFTKLRRARKDGRAQYLKIQATELIETKKDILLDTAEMLLNKILTDYPNNRVEKSQTLNSLGQICKLRKDYEKALHYFRESLEFEKEFPNVITCSYLSFAETVIQAKKTELYDEVEDLLNDEIKKDELRFPSQNYVIFSVLSVISDFKSSSDKAKIYADLAELSATATTNMLWNPRKKRWGIVTKRKSWLDKLVKRSTNDSTK